MTEQNPPPEPADHQPTVVPDDPDYPDTVEGTGSEREDEPGLDEPVVH